MCVYVRVRVCVRLCKCGPSVAKAAKELLPCCLLCQFAGKITFLLIVADAWAVNIKSNSKRSSSNYSSNYLQQQLPAATREARALTLKQQ